MDNQIWREYQEAGDIAALEAGAYRSVLPLMVFCDEPATTVPMDFDPTIYEHKKILIVPSGALNGYEGSKFFKARLDEFVKQGGVIICFSQPWGYNYGALPPMGPDPGPLPAPPYPPHFVERGKRNGSEEGKTNLAGYGFQQDQNCSYKGSYLDQIHPILKNQQDAQMFITSDAEPTYATIGLARQIYLLPAWVGKM